MLVRINVGKQVMKDLRWQCKGMSSNLTIFHVPNKCEQESSLGGILRRHQLLWRCIQTSGPFEVCPSLLTIKKEMHDSVRKVF